MDQALLWIQPHPPPPTDPEKMSMEGCMLLHDPHCSGSKWAAADQYSASMSASGGLEGSNADPRNERRGVVGVCGGVGVLSLLALWSLTRLLSYSFLEAAKSWALEIAIPQNGRYICSTCGRGQQGGKNRVIYRYGPRSHK